VSTELVETSGI